MPESMMITRILCLFLHDHMFFVIPVKSMSELADHRQTPSPNMQSFGGFRTNHGRIRILKLKQKLVLLSFSFYVFSFMLILYWQEATERVLFSFVGHVPTIAAGHFGFTLDLFSYTDIVLW